MTFYEDLDDLRSSCPPGTTLVGPEGSGVLNVTVNEKVSAVCTKPDGTRHGPSTTWYADGSKADTGSYLDDVKQGEWVFWHEIGQMSGRGTFRDGRPEATFETWHDNGQLASLGSYTDGKHHGHFTQLDLEGRIVQVLHYEHGELIKTIPYRDGKPIE